jgi:hypothetical protein
VVTSEERKAKNEAIFREANEKIDAVRERLNIDARTPYLCECDLVECRESIRLTPAEYEEVRSSPIRFALAPGHPHEGPVVDERRGYVIVEKTGAGAKVALESDPRSDDA